METSFDLESLASTLTLSNFPIPGSDTSGKMPLAPPLLPNNLTSHDEFWLPDGNLILVAESVGFRVYRGLLSEQSTVFADMLASSSENDEETFDGCPIVHLSNSPQELAHLFRILLPKSRRRLHPRISEKHTFDEVSALARLSHKYHIEDVEEQALDLLHQQYPDSFDQWVRGPAFISVTSLFHAIGAVNIARLTDTPSLLPLALYRCCNLGPQLLDGWKREDGHVEHLSVDDLKICFAARETLCKEGAQIFFKVFHDQPSQQCPQPDKCRAVLNAMVQFLMKRALSLAIECSVLSSWKSMINAGTSDYEICAKCTKELHARDKKARREAWDRFPDIFSVSVPGWGEK